MAEFSYKQAISLDKDNEEYYLKTAEILANQDRTDEAMLCLENGSQSIEMGGPRSKILNNLGLLKMEQAGRDVGLLEEAFELLNLSHTLDPGCFNALLNCGLVLDAMGRYDEAYSFYKGAIAIRPKHPTALLGIGNYLFRVGRYNESIVVYEEAAATQESSDFSQPRAVFMIGQAHRFGLYNQTAALQAYERALIMDPFLGEALIGKVQAMRAIAMWEDLEQFDARMRDIVVEQMKNTASGEKKKEELLPMYDSLFNPELTTGMVKAIAEFHALNRHQSGEFWPRSNVRSMVRELQLRTEDGHSFKLNVVYLSFDFREHPMGYLTKGLVCGHNESRISSFVASYGPDDGSTPRKLIERCASHFGRFLDISDLTDVNSALKIRETSPHILVDFMGGTTSARDTIVSLRPSPITLNYLGFPSTIGSAADFFVVDARVVPPEAVRSAVGEAAVIYLPDAYQANDYALHDNVCLPSYGGIQSSCEKMARESRGLHYDAPTLCNFNSIDKLEPIALSLALQVISRVPGSVLVLLSPPARNLEAVHQNVAQEAASRGVDPKRILWESRLPKKEHIERTSAICDLFIDSLVYGAHTTAADALWAGVPLVTVGGVGVVGKEDMSTGMPGRVAHSLLSAIGLPELSTSSVKSSIDVCVSLLQSKNMEKGGGGALYVLRKRVLRATLSSPVFDTRRTVRAMEAAYEAAWEQLVQDISPYHHILVGHEEKLESLFPKNRIQELDNLLIAYDQSKGDPIAMERARSASHRMISASNVSLVGPRLAWVSKLMHGAGGWQDSVNEVTKAALLCYLLNSNCETRAWEVLGHSSLRASREDVRNSVRWYDIAQFARLSLLESAVRANASDVIMWSNPMDTADRFLGLIKSYSSVLNIKAALLALQPLLVAESRLDDLIALHNFGVSDKSPMQLAVVLEKAGRREESYNAYRKAVMDQNANEFKIRGSHYLRLYNVPRKIGQLVIAIYCNEYGQAWFPNWGPSSLENGGLGGSEEAVVLLSRELTALGYRVEIYADPIDSDIGIDPFGVVWYSTSMFDVETPPDIFIAWRYHASLPLGDRSTKTFLWLHDVPDREYPPQLKNEIDGIFCLSSYHASLIRPNTLQSITYVTPNGIDSSQFVDGENHPLRFVYGSAPNCGLEAVLIAWPYIVERLQSKLKYCEGASVDMEPNLYVYYGFIPSFQLHGRKIMNNFDVWMERMEKLLQQDGIVNIGMVDHSTLAKGYAEAGFILYPTTFQETGCITIMKAMAQGAIPITSRFINSTLPDLTEPWDLGPSDPIPHTVTLDTLPPIDWIYAWADAVVSAAEKATKE